MTNTWESVRQIENNPVQQIHMNKAFHAFWKIKTVALPHHLWNCFVNPKHSDLSFIYHFPFILPDADLSTVSMEHFS